MKKIFLLIMAAFALMACEKAENNSENIDIKSPISFSVGLATKATDAGFEQNDKVGIYMAYTPDLAGSQNYVDNNQYTLTGSKWITGQEIYWKDKTSTANFICYHPYAGVSDARAHRFTVKSDQSKIADYKASDFLWGKKADVAPLSNTVAISTHHLMSNLLIYLKAGKGFTAEEFAAADKSLQLGNVKLNANIDLSNGNVVATGDKASIVPYWNGEAYRAAVVPQHIDQTNNLIVVSINGVSYALNSEIDLVAGTQHTLNVTVNKTNSGLNISIEKWLIDEVPHNGEAF